MAAEIPDIRFVNREASRGFMASGVYYAMFSCGDEERADDSVVARQGDPVRDRQRMPLRTCLSSTLGIPRDLVGNSGWMMLHSASVSS